MISREDVARIAEEAVAARSGGKQRLVVGRVSFNLTEKGYCARFVRQCHEAALGLPEFGWVYKAPTAWDMEGRLREAGLRVAQPRRGDILCFNRKAEGPPGHIGLYLGGGRFAENTSSGSRGEPRAPGTKISLLEPLQGRVSGCYAALPDPVPAPEGEIKLVLLPGSEVLPCRPRLEGDLTRVDLRPLAEALGYEVYDHLAEEGKVYLRPRGMAVVSG